MNTKQTFMLDINPIKTDANCYVNNFIIQTANHYSIEYRPIFMRYLNDYFKWDETTNLLQMDPCYKDEDKYEMEHLIGFRWDRVEFCNIESMLEIIKDNLANECPLGLEMNERYIPWTKYKRDIEREVIIVGINKNYLYCADGYMSLNREIFPCSEIRESMILYQLSRQDNFHLQRTNLLNAILHKVTGEKMKQRTDSMNEFGKMISNYDFSTIPTLSYDEIAHSKFIYTVSHIISNRIYCYKYLQQLFEQYEIILGDDIKQLITEAEKKLLMFKGLLTKSIIMKSISHSQKLKNVFFDFVHIENEICLILLSLKQNNGISNDLAIKTVPAK